MLAFGGDHLLCRRLADGFRQARTDHRVLGGEGPVGDALPAAGHRADTLWSLRPYGERPTTGRSPVYEIDFSIN